MKIIFLSLLLLGCATSSPLVKHKELPKLPETTEVTVYFEEPPFSYNVICEKQVDSSPLTSKEILKTRATIMARQCGSAVAMVKSQYYRKTDVKVIEQTSEVDTLVGKEMLSKLATAASVDNISNVKTILTTLKTSRDPNVRSINDTRLLSYFITLLANKEDTCPKKVMTYLHKDYNVKMEAYAHESNYLTVASVLNCNSEVIANSYSNLKDKEKNITEINNALTDKLNSGFANLYKVAMRNYRKIYPQIKKDLDAACAKDAVSVLCSLKPNMEKLNKAIPANI